MMTSAVVLYPILLTLLCYLQTQSAENDVMSVCAPSFAMMRRSFRAVPRAGSLCALINRRSYAVQAAGAPRFQVFNRRTKWLQRERAASNPDEGRQADYLKDEIAMRVSERLLVSAVRGSSPRRQV